MDGVDATAVDVVFVVVGMTISETVISSMVLGVLAGIRSFNLSCVMKVTSLSSLSQ